MDLGELIGGFPGSEYDFCLIHDHFLVDYKGFEMTRVSSHTG